MPDRQHRVVSVGREVFGDNIMDSKQERLLRAGEEFVELLQAGGLNLNAVLQLVHYVYSRPVGELSQEMAGCGVCLYALADAHHEDLDALVDIEVQRIFDNKAKIRAKHALKPADIVAEKVAA